MAQAKSIKDLHKIRAYHRKTLDKFNSNLGTALGFKKYSGKKRVSKDPAILVFVEEKINPKWLPDAQIIPKTLEIPGGLWCHVDVIQGGVGDVVKGGDLHSDVLERLRGWDDYIYPGSQIAVINKKDDTVAFGTITAFVKKKKGKTIGLLTNEHVALSKGTDIYFPSDKGIHLATTIESYEYIYDEYWFQGVDEKDTYFAIDCGFAKLAKGVKSKWLKNEIITKNPKRNLKLGSVIDFDTNSMQMIGLKVAKLGRTTGYTTGTIIAAGFEMEDEKKWTGYTDFVIAGYNGKAFSAPGDSGSLIFSNDKSRNPIGLLWGGWEHQFRHGRGLEDITYGVSLKKVLDFMGLELL